MHSKSFPFLLLFVLVAGCTRSEGGTDSSANPQTMSAEDAASMVSDSSRSVSESMDAGATLDGSPIELDSEPDDLGTLDATPDIEPGPDPDLGIDVDGEVTVESDSGDAMPSACETQCANVVACAIDRCDGFDASDEAELTRRCLNRCNPAIARIFARRDCDGNIAFISNQDQLVAEACQAPERPDEMDPQNPIDDDRGVNTLYIGHSFGRPFANALTDFAEDLGIGGHVQRIVFSGGDSGAPLALWNNEARRAEIQAILDGGEVEVMVMICCSQGFVETGQDQGIVNWMDYALARNPDTSFALAMPWVDFPEDYPTAAEYGELWERGYVLWRGLVDALREANPGVEIFTIPHGLAAVQLRSLFELEQLPDVAVMRGPSHDAIFTDPKGHAAQILKDLGTLIWLGSIYGVDVSGFELIRDYQTDLASMAQAILDSDDYTR